MSDDNNTTEDEDQGFFDAVEEDSQQDDDMSTSQRDDEFVDAVAATTSEDDDDASQLSSSSSEGPTPRDNRSYLPGASHPLLPDGALQNRSSLTTTEGSSCLRDSTLSNPSAATQNQQPLQLPILELPGIVLFPGCTIPIRLSNRSWIQHLGSQIDASRTVSSPDFGRTVQLGILTREELPPPETRARTEDGRRRSSFLRQGVRNSRQQQRLSRILQQELGDDMSDSEDDDENDTSTPPIHRHAFVGRIGTIATVTYTHGDALLDDMPRRANSTISRASGVWQRHAEEQGELILQAVGTARFRVESYMDFQSFADVQVFGVREFQQDQRPLSCPTTPVPRKLPYDASRINTTEESTMDHSDNTRRSSLRSSHKYRHNNPLINTKYMVSHHDSLIRQLALVTPLPQLIYKQIWPWRLVGQMVTTIQTKASLRSGSNDDDDDDELATTPNSLLQSLAELLQDPETATLMDHPSQFSFWMASNMPLSMEQKLHLLHIPTTVERLQTLQNHLKDFTKSPMKVCCQACRIPLSNIDCVFTVGGADGTTSNHVNEHGFIHQVVTLRQVRERWIYLSGRPSTDNSYFPGYSWTVTYCRRCGSLLGWKFNWVGIDEDSADGTMSVRSRRSSRRHSENRPPSFFGFMSSSLITQEES